MIIEPIAFIHTDFDEKFGIPRQSGRVGTAEGTIVFQPEFRNRDALREIERFTYLWLIFDFSESHRGKWSPTVRPPRLGGNKRVGVFASRSPFRPNSLGLSCVRLVNVENTRDNGHVLRVSGVDLLNMTPIFDIKPYIPYADCHTDAQGGYADEFADYRLNVEFSENLLKKIPPEKREALIGCLSDDPRPSYQDDSKREYSMKYAGFDISFTVDKNTLIVTRVINCDKF